ncbi:MAG: T9SS type A sorting domain-containing protein, partial [Sphingobacteriia bacterium]|nr:T9SS type A sorting domain-containing protein [Sphingobacteriia bacterium]
GKGILEFNNDQLVNIYDSSNTPMALNVNGNYIGGLAMDKHGNLWASNSNTGKILTVRTPQNNWYTYSLAPYAAGNNVSKIFIDSSSYKWIILPRSNGLVVFDDNGTLDNPNDDRKKSLNINQGTRVSTNQINCITQDLDGSIWIGTDKGVKVYYNSSSIFDNNSPAPQTILIEQDGYVQNLLEFENVSCIAVDGANQKWIGTSKAGLFVMSPDGTKEIYSYTESNSPLLSNTIMDVVINHKNGEIFVATDKGVVSYRGLATMGGETISDEIQIFPNPVRENYNGYIAMNGLTRNANVKISDINGRLVFQTIAKGGQANWDGKNFNGEKVQTGIYLIFSSDADGVEKVVGKIMFIH